MIHRQAVRALLLAEPGQLLLCRIAIPKRDIDLWIAPGGGIEPEENPEQALVREIYEETGFSLSHWLGPGPVWKRHHRFEFRGETIDQHEVFYLVRTERFRPDHRGNPAEIEQDLFREFRWWAIDEIRNSEALFVPGSIARHLQNLIQFGCPDDPVDVGV